MKQWSRWGAGEDDDGMSSNAYRAPASQSLSDAPAACDATHLENFWSRGSKGISGTSHLETMIEGPGRGHFSVCSSNRALFDGQRLISQGLEVEPWRA